MISSRGMGALAFALPRRKKRGVLPGPPPSLGVRCHAEKGCPPCRSQGHGELSVEGHLASLLSGSPAWGPVPRAGAGRPEAVAAVTRFLIPPLASASVPRGAAGVDAMGLGSRGHWHGSKGPGFGGKEEAGRGVGNKAAGNPRMGCERAEERWSRVPGRRIPAGTAWNCGWALHHAGPTNGMK